MEGATSLGSLRGGQAMCGVIGNSPGRMEIADSSERALSGWRAWGSGKGLRGGWWRSRVG